MEPYIITFTISLFFAFLAIRHYKGNLSLISIIFISISIIVPALLAAGRTEEIGTDVNNYVVPIWNLVHTLDSSLLSAIFAIGYIEPGYIVINWLVAQFSDDIFWLLLIIQLVILIPIYIGAFKLKKKLSPLWILFLYYCVIYNETLNLVRQSIALSFCFLALSFLFDNKDKIFIVISVFAFFFHNSAILMFLIYLLYLFCTKGYVSKYRIFTYGIIGFGIFCVFSFSILINIFVQYGLLKVKYLAFAEGAFDGHLSKVAFFFKLFSMLLVWWLTSKTRKINSLLKKFFKFVAFYDVLFCLMGATVVYITRISLYTQLVMFIILALLFNGKQGVAKITSIKILFFLSGLFYWYFAFVVSGVSDTYPYKSILFGIS